MADASTVPSSWTCCRVIDPTFCAVMPVGAVDAPDRPTSQSKVGQSWPWATVSGATGPLDVVFGVDRAHRVKMGSADRTTAAQSTRHLTVMIRSLLWVAQLRHYP